MEAEELQFQIHQRDNYMNGQAVGPQDGDEQIMLYEQDKEMSRSHSQMLTKKKSN